MKQVYLLKGLDCPHCAGQIEQEVRELPGVTAASVNLMGQTLTVQTEGEERLLRQVKGIVHSHEPHVQVSLVEGDIRHDHHGEENRGMVPRLCIGGVLFVLGVILSFTALPKVMYLMVLVAAYVVLGCDVVVAAARNIVKGRVFDENFLMSLSSIGAFIIGEHLEAVAVMLFYQIGEYFQSRAVRHSRRSIAALMDIRPEFATVKRGARFVTVSPETVAVGDIIQVRPGQKIPLDGVVLEGESMLDTRALTGESVPRGVHSGDTALSGCVNGNGLLTIQVTKVFAESTASKILELVENASGRKAKTENFITKFARWYTPAVVILAALLAVIPPLVLGQSWTEWIRRGFVFLVISCPCALVISIPMTFFGGIGAASRHGVLVKGGNFLEALNSVDTVVFDKTGTLTRGEFAVSQILPAEGFRQEQVLRLAARAESLSDHPIARSILADCGEPAFADPPAAYTQIPGCGVRAAADGQVILAGNRELMAREEIAYVPCDKPGTKVYVAVDGQFAGCIRISDRVKPDSRETIAQLKKMGIRQTLMLTGDDEAIAAELAKELGLDGYRARLMPEDKVAILEQLDARKPKGRKIAFVGDGINDAPVLARADVGIAMGALGSDAAIEAADVVLMTDEPGRLPDALRVARYTRRIVTQNIVLALGIKAVFLVLGAFGVAGMWEAVFADVGVALLAVGNAMRILKK